MSQVIMLNETTQEDEETRKEIQEVLDNAEVHGYVLLLRVKTEHEEKEIIHMFNVGNNFEELTDMLMSANQYLPSKEMEGG